MQIIVAPDSFKGSASATEVAHYIEKGIYEVDPTAKVIKIPIADGGEGTVEAIVTGAKGSYKHALVKGPLGEKIQATYGLLEGDVAVIEMAAASGITIIPKEKLNPMITTTYGTGQLIKAALDEGVRKIILGIGGSVTNDGGVGMAQALGASFKNQIGEEVGFGGGSLKDIHYIDISGLDPRIKEVEFIVACDVINPLCGEQGASAIYGPQKGAGPDEVRELDEGLRHYAQCILRDLGKDIVDIPGTGAAGGLGAGLLVFCNATLKSGIQTVLDVVNIEQYLSETDLIITGEGRIDGQSIYGKVPVGIAQVAANYNIPVIVIAGSIGDDASKVYDYGISALTTIVEGPISLDEAMEKAPELIRNATTRIMKTMWVGHLVYSS